MGLAATAVVVLAAAASYFAFSFVACALHVRFAPRSRFSRVFRKFPSLALVYPFFLVGVIIKSVTRMISVRGGNLFVRLFEVLSGRKVYRRHSSYNYTSKPDL